MSTPISMNKLNPSFSKNYDWILFDADDTLFHFDAFAGLKLMFSRCDVEFNNENYEEYQKVNKALWVEYQDSKISAKELQNKRFDAWSNRLGISSENLNSAFLNAMADLCAPLEGAVDLLNALNGRVKLGIITNGFKELQQARLQRTGLKEFFEFIVISEEVGFAKPNPRIFDHALSLMGDPDRSKVLMVGDTLESDILGGVKSGLDTCWLNRHGRIAPDGMIPNHEVLSLKELQELLLGETVCSGK